MFAYCGAHLLGGLRGNSFVAAMSTLGSSLCIPISKQPWQARAVRTKITSTAVTQVWPRFYPSPARTWAIGTAACRARFLGRCRHRDWPLTRCPVTPRPSHRRRCCAPESGEIGAIYTNVRIGPPALGARTILANPTQHETHDLLNVRLESNAKTLARSS